MIRGMILINENPICAMFDTGASHSFISDSCAEKLHLRVDELSYDVCVSSPMGAKVVTHKTCLNCVIQYEQLSDTTDLICLPFKGIDVIMGLSWLTANNVLIDCGNKTLVVIMGLSWLTANNVLIYYSS